jgi:hypothetical protein
MLAQDVVERRVERIFGIDWNKGNGVEGVARAEMH